MEANDHFTRVDTLELKNLIYQRIGHQRAEKYLDQLKRFLSSRLNKVEFDKGCIQTIGRENLSLHNLLIRSVIHNACQAKNPPRKAQKIGPLAKVTNDSQRGCLQSLYGDMLPQSPRKSRSPAIRDRKLRDRPSPLGPLGKSPSLTCEETVSRLLEPHSAAELGSLSGRPLMGAALVEDGEEVEQLAVIPRSQRWSSITAPLGVSVNVGGDRRGLHLYLSYHETCQSSGELPDTSSLLRRLQKKLASEGVDISVDGANALSKGLDAYLKNIISGSVGIARSRCTYPFAVRTGSNGQMISGFNGILPEGMPTQHANVSMLDFLVSMESNPSTQLNKIYNYTIQ